MGLKDVFKKIGKIGLMAAPYVAAPFTGGLSLAATGLANKAVGKWSESDAKKNAAKGLAPSKFDNILNKAGNISSMASMFVPGGGIGGALGKLGKAADVGSKASKIMSGVSAVTGGQYNPSSAPAGTGTVMTNQKTPYGTLPVNAKTNRQAAGIGPSSKATDLFNAAMASGAQRTKNTMGGAQAQVGQNTDKGGFDWKQLVGLAGPVAAGIYGAKKLSEGGGGGDFSSATPIRERPDYSGNMKGARQLGSAMSMKDQSNPNLALALGQGRLEGIKNQPFRRGYDVSTSRIDPETEEETITTSRMPRISPMAPRSNRQRQQQESQSRRAGVR